MQNKIVDIKGEKILVINLTDMKKLEERGFSGTEIYDLFKDKNEPEEVNLIKKEPNKINHVRYLINLLNQIGTISEEMNKGQGFYIREPYNKLAIEALEHYFKYLENNVTAKSN